MRHLPNRNPTSVIRNPSVKICRFQSGKIPSSQVTEIVTRHVENMMVTKHLYYVVKVDQNRFYHLVYIMDKGDWRMVKEVDEEFYFVK